MDRIQIKDKKFRLFISDEEIQAAVRNVSEGIKNDVRGKDVLFVCMLNGAFMFATELMKEIDASYPITFARYSSYEGTASTGVLHEIMPVKEDLRGKTVYILEDIIDTGFTMQCMKSMLLDKGAAEVKLVTMLFKPESLRCDLKPDYVGLEIAPAFIVGHGLDYDGEGRAFKDIYQVEE